MKGAIVRTVLVGLGLALALSGSHILEGQTSTPEIMRQKLGHAQDLLRAIILDELDSAEEQARELDRLAELQSWYVLPTPEYAEHSKKFRESAQAAAEAARAGRGSDTFEAYAGAIRQCVDCHAYMRRVRGAAGRDVQ